MLAVSNESFEYEPPVEIIDVRTGRAAPEVLLTPRDRNCLRAFDEINAALLELSSVILGAEEALKRGGKDAKDVPQRLAAAQDRFTLQLKFLCQTIFAHDMEALQTIYDLKKQ